MVMGMVNESGLRVWYKVVWIIFYFMFSLLNLNYISNYVINF